VQLERYYDRISRAGVDLFAVSVDPPETSAALRERLKVNFTFLSDTDAVLLDALGVKHVAGRRDGADMAYPASILVDEHGLVRWAFQSDTYRERARPETIFAAIDDL